MAEQRQHPLAVAVIRNLNFINEPLNNKPVKWLPGIGETTSDRMNTQNFTKASQVYGQYLVLNRDPVAFESWLKSNFQVDRHRARQCSNALEIYYKNFN